MIWPNFLLDDALDSFRIHSEDGEDDLAGSTTWPEAVQYFLRTYVKDSYLERAVPDMGRLRQKEGEDERAFERRLTKPSVHVRRCFQVPGAHYVYYTRGARDNTPSLTAEAPLLARAGCVRHVRRARGGIRGDTAR